MSSHGTNDYRNIEFENDLFLIFGKESVGLPKSITDNNQDKLYKIPILNEYVRSLNLANAVSVVVYEGIPGKLR